MSFKLQLNLGLGIMLGVLVLMGLIPALTMNQSSRQETALQETLQKAQRMAVLDQQFRDVQVAFAQGLSTGHIDFGSLLAKLDQCIVIPGQLADSAGDAHIRSDTEMALTSFSKSIRLFRFAIEMYRTEMERDPAADNTHQMAMNAVMAQEQAAQAFLDFTQQSFHHLFNSHRVIFESLRRNEYWSISLILCGLILAICLAMFLSRRLSKPIRELLQAAQYLSGGDMDFKLNVDRGGEFGDLARAFDRMRNEIKSRIKVQEVMASEAQAAASSERSKAEELGRTNEQLTAEIAARQSAQKRLQESFAATNEILERLPFGVIIIGRDKKIRMLNRSALRMMGYDSSNGLINQVCHRVICPAQHDQCPILDLGQQVDNSEKILLGRGDQKIPILKTVVPITLGEEEVLLEAFVDVSALKQVETQLRYAMDRAEAANRSKSEFLANMSHELRTPLNHIIGFTELIADKNCGDINPVQEEYLNDVLRAGRHLLSLINDILDLSKIEAGKMEVDMTDVSIRDMLSNSLTMIKEKALKHSIHLSLNIESTPDYLVGDERKLKQVMYNLLSNAAKFTPDGGHIEVGSRIHNGNGCPAGTTDGRSLKVWVKDTGIGIEPQNLDRIFAPFEQVESSTSRKFQGTGLGLSLTRKIVELHGGRIHARSEGNGQGTVFEFTLPIGAAH